MSMARMIPSPESNAAGAIYVMNPWAACGVYGRGSGSQYCVLSS